MDSSPSILDKVLQNKQQEQLLQFNPEDVLRAILAHVNDREKEVLTERFGLSGNKPKTLELIGKRFGVTRERVRQIETSTVKKLKKLDALAEQLKVVESVINQVLNQHGGLMEQDHLLDNVLINAKDSETNRAILRFFLQKLLDSKYDKIHHAQDFHHSWKFVTLDKEGSTKLIDALIDIVEEHGEPIKEEELVSKYCESCGTDMDENHVRARLRVSKKLKQNIFDHWGRANWSSITPKRMNDKVYLVLKELGDPLHFTEIADKINDLKFDHKVAYPATVHNELILDEKFVLVGRGIYALAEWGYQPGVVADVIARVLEDMSKPMSREDIVQKVLDQRMVSKSTIHLALMNKKRFNKTADGRYEIMS